MKKVIILFALLFITGCDVTYNVTVTSDKKIIETLNFVVEKSEIEAQSSDIKVYIKEQIANYKKSSMFKNYDFSYKIRKDKVYFEVTKTYLNVEEYEKSQLYKEMFDSLYSIDGKEFYFSTRGNFRPLNSDSPDPDFEQPDTTINIKFHNKVLTSNADAKNEKSNVHTWTIKNTDKDRFIEFQLDNEKRYDIIILDYINDNKFVVIPAIAVIAVIIGGAVFVLSKYKLNNRI